MTPKEAEFDDDQDQQTEKGLRPGSYPPTLHAEHLHSTLGWGLDVTLE